MATVVRQQIPIHFERSLKADARSTDEDWSGLSSATERRKLQNRINARAYRKRKAQAKTGRNFPATSDSGPENYWPAKNVDSTRPSPNNVHSGSAIVVHNAGNLIGTPLSSTQSPVLPYRPQHDTNTYPIIFTPSPSTDLLISLVYYNVYRAIISNFNALGWDLFEICDEDYISPFCRGESGTHLPPSLRPTSLQKAHPHHPMCDVFPDTNFREKLIMFIGLYNEEELCEDLVGFVCDTQNKTDYVRDVQTYGEIMKASRSSSPQIEGTEAPMDTSRQSIAGLIVWGEPWDVKSWEMTETFYRKWFFLVCDSLELIESSNRWRAERGEPPLQIEEAE